MIEKSLSTEQLLYYTVTHYLQTNFSPLRITFPTLNEKVQYIRENALHLNLGKNVDHVEFCLFLAANSPFYGTIVKDISTINQLRKSYRPERFKATRFPKTVQSSIKKLPTNTQALVLMEATKFTSNKIKLVLGNWSTEKPVLLIG